MNKHIRLNGQITAQSVRLIDADSTQVGIVSLSEALSRAAQAGLDLAEISPHANPPVVKILDWGKYRYEQQKQQQKSKAKAKASELKQIRLGLKTDAHDINVKVKAAEKFLTAGHKVKVNVRFKGREITHPELGRAVIDGFYAKISDVAVIENQPSMNGRELSMTLTRRKDAKNQDEKSSSEAS